MSTIKEGDIIHGTTSCGNVYQVLLFGEMAAIAKSVVLLKVMKMTAPVAKADWDTGNLVLRARDMLDYAHLAKGCPRGA